MIPRFIVTSVALLSPVILRTEFSLSLPFRYSITSTLIPIGPTSWKPACGPSVFPDPRSTRKLNSAYGRSRRTAISSSFGRFAGRSAGWLLEPHQIVVGQLELLHRNVAALRVEVRSGPLSRPRTEQLPGVD